MTVDSRDGDYCSPEEKHRIHEEWLNSEQGQRVQTERKWESRKASVVGAVVWILVGLLALVVGSAVLKWAIKELSG